MFLSFTQIGIFDEVIWLCLSPGTFGERCLQDGSGKKYTFGMALGPCKQHFIMFLQGLKLFSSSDI
jgi:hypothetical protein